MIKYFKNFKIIKFLLFILFFFFIILNHNFIYGLDKEIEKEFITFDVYLGKNSNKKDITEYLQKNIKNFDFSQKKILSLIEIDNSIINSNLMAIYLEPSSKELFPSKNINNSKDINYTNIYFFWFLENKNFNFNIKENMYDLLEQISQFDFIKKEDLKKIKLKTFKKINFQRIKFCIKNIFKKLSKNTGFILQNLLNNVLFENFVFKMLEFIEIKTGLFLNIEILNFIEINLNRFEKIKEEVLYFGEKKTFLGPGIIFLKEIFLIMEKINNSINENLNIVIKQFNEGIYDLFSGNFFKGFLEIFVDIPKKIFQGFFNVIDQIMIIFYQQDIYLIN
ncbi:hypothetical protein ATP_00197 [Candidatus Phytoplasma mali]|uniref:Uncharacterized protein n=1 Tax=Phytoplasma mali (strain AT) TaxID=482235 RepID=B3R0M0_PHYMT|nr:hypothetical protein [Candidatus Phytoplasma mali]CAP18384.1 hypothetical protein ATP_00197 [Candidatus Phytoplasma mali]